MQICNCDASELTKSVLALFSGWSKIHLFVAKLRNKINKWSIRTHKICARGLLVAIVSYFYFLKFLWFLSYLFFRFGILFKIAWIFYLFLFFGSFEFLGLFKFFGFFSSWGLVGMEWGRVGGHHCWSLVVILLQNKK